MAVFFTSGKTLDISSVTSLSATLGASGTYRRFPGNPCSVAGSGCLSLQQNSLGREFSAGGNPGDFLDR